MRMRLHDPKLSEKKPSLSDEIYRLLLSLDALFNKQQNEKNATPKSQTANLDELNQAYMYLKSTNEYPSDALTNQELKYLLTKALSELNQREYLLGLKNVSGNENKVIQRERQPVIANYETKPKNRYSSKNLKKNSRPFDVIEFVNSYVKHDN